MRVKTTALALAAAIAAIGCGSNVVTGTGGNGGGTGAGGNPGTGGNGGGISPCPAAEPSSGDVTCSDVAPGFRCTYGDSVRPDCRREWICSVGIWTTTKNICLDPPPNACGPAEPAADTLCNGLDGSVCTYGDDICLCSACPGGPCMPNAHWFCTKPPTTAGCPPVVPNDGTACSAPGAKCSYGFPCNASGTRVECTGGLWKWNNDIACPL